MAMDPRTHPRGRKPDFSMAGLPPNPNPARITNAMWWLVCMRLKLEPLSRNGGIYANKAGSHNAGENLPDFGANNPQTDHSIRHPWNRTGPWWEQYSAGLDWTFEDAHSKDYKTINKYVGRMLRAMRDPNDTRPDEVMFYCIGQEDSDASVEGWHELRDEAVSGDITHWWHRHDSLFRWILGSFQAMWKILTIDMGWSFQDWQNSVEDEMSDWRGDDINPDPNVTSTAGGAAWTILQRTNILNQLPGQISAFQTELATRVEDVDDDLDAQGAILLVMDAKLNQILVLLAQLTEEGPPSPAV